MIISKILSEIKIVFVLENEAERMLGGGIHPEVGHETHSAVEIAVCHRLPVQPLPVVLGKRSTLRKILSLTKNVGKHVDEV